MKIRESLGNSQENDGKEITVTLEDALFSAKSMAIMFGNGTVKNYAGTSAQPKFIMKTEMFNIGELTSTDVAEKDTINEVLGITTGKVDGSTKSLGGWSTVFTAPDGHTYYKQNPKFYTADGVQITKIATAEGGQPADVFWPVNGVTLTTNDGTKGRIIAAGEKIFCSYDLAISGSVIEISANSFPGTYYVTGDTFARSELSGEDEFFQFIILRAKVTSENTITLEAEGDPSVFNLNLRVLRGDNGQMMKLVKYDLTDSVGRAADEATTIIHNHVLVTNNENEYASAYPGT